MTDMLLCTLDKKRQRYIKRRIKTVKEYRKGTRGKKKAELTLVGGGFPFYK